MEANRLIGGVLSRHQGDAAGAIQELFHLLGEVDESLHESIRIAILFALESLHEWSNLLKYLQRWNLPAHRKKVLERMRHRLNDYEVTTSQEQVQLERLVNKYWLVRSPKKEERIYREPILLNNILRNFGKSEGVKENKPKEKEGDEKKENQKEKQKQIEKGKEDDEKRKSKIRQLEIQKKGGDKGSNNIKQVKPIEKKVEENSNKEQKSERQKDPLAKVTGRPPILKKSSIIDNNKQQKRDHKSFNIPSNDAVQLILNYNRKKQLQLQQQQKQAGNDKPIEVSSQNQPRPIDQKLPSEKFNFGSSKKSKNAQMLKKIPVSPKKYEPQRKVIRIKREQPRPQERVIQNKGSLDFSFCKDSDSAPPSQQNIGSQNNLQPFRISPFKFKEVPVSEYKDIPKITISRQSMHQRDSFGGDDPTPMFVFNQDSRSRHSVKEPKWLSDEEMNLLEPGIYKDMLGKLRRSQGLTAARILSQFVKI